MLSIVAPPLTVDEVLKAVSGVNWRRLGKELLGEYDYGGFGDHVSRRTNLDIIHDEHKSDVARLRAVVEEFLDTGTSIIFWGEILNLLPWKRVIWTLYRIDEIDKAQQIKSYAEPFEGMQLLIYTMEIMCCVVLQASARYLILLELSSNIASSLANHLSCHLLRGICCS